MTSTTTNTLEGLVDRFVPGVQRPRSWVQHMYDCGLGIVAVFIAQGFHADLKPFGYQQELSPAVYPILLLVTFYWGLGPGTMAAVFGFLFAYLPTAALRQGPSRMLEEAIFAVALVSLGSMLRHRLCQKNALRPWSEEAFKRWIDSSPVAAMIHTEEGTVLHTNDVWTELSGYSAKDIPTVSEWIDVARGGRLTPSEDFKSAKKRSDKGEFNILTKTGENRIWHFFSAPLGRDQQNRHLVVTMALDVTERKQAEARIEQLNENLLQRNRALAEEKKRWKAVVQGIAEEVWVCDANGKMSLINLAAVTTMGLQAFTNKTVYQVYEEVEILNMDGKLRPPEDAPLLRSLRGEVVRGEEIMRHRVTGKTRCRQYSSSPIRDSHGRITGAVSVNRDITEQKRTEEALHRSEKQLRTATDAAEIGVWTWIPQTQEMSVSTRWRRHLNLPLELTVSFETWMQALHPEDRDSFSKQLTDACERHQEFNFEYRVLRDDEVHWLTDRGRASYDGEGFPIQMDGVTVDITERKHAEAQLRHAKLTAEAANGAKSNFLAVMSHELRTPLTAILGFSELLSQSDLAPLEREDCVYRIRRNGELLTKLIGEILDLSKIEAEKLELECIEVNLSEILSDLMGILSHLASQKGLTLQLECLTPLPKIVLTDPTRLRQILTNLVGNAIKFTQAGHVRVLVETDERAKQIRFFIEDTGEGIDMSKAEKIFEPFVQADSSDTRKYGGTGLGLNLSRRLARAMGGDVILLQGLPQRGSTFVVSIALKTPEVASELKRDRADARKGPEKALFAGVDILVVDDVDDNQVLIKRILDRAGANVEVASSGQEAIEKAFSHHFKVILMDMQMPGMDGYEATRLLRAKGYQRPIFALTANVMQTDREKALAAGCDDHIAKPVSKEMLVEALRAHLNLGSCSG